MYICLQEHGTFQPLAIIIAFFNILLKSFISFLKLLSKHKHGKERNVGKHDSDIHLFLNSNKILIFVICILLCFQKNVHCSIAIKNRIYLY